MVFALVLYRFQQFTGAEMLFLPSHFSQKKNHIRYLIRKSLPRCQVGSTLSLEERVESFVEQ